MTAVMLAACFAAAPEDSMLKIKAGDKFPDVKLAAAQIDRVKKDAKDVSIADVKGKIAVIFFYPKASTRGCTVESCGFRDAAKDFPDDSILIGASADDAKAQQKFIDDHKLPFALLCDTKLELIKALGIQSPKGNVPQRVTFVVGRDGTVAKVYEKVNPEKHPAEVLAFVKELAAKK
jgi:thioredoxin-dependent peroxiredoxin